MDFFVQLFTNPVGFYNQHELLIAQIGINAILAISIFVTFYSGQLTLANAGFMAIGAYTTVIMVLYLPTPLPVDMLVGALLAGLGLLGRTLIRWSRPKRQDGRDAAGVELSPGDRALLEREVRSIDVETT